MARQKPWDQYEAVILLEATVRVHEGTLDRKKAISDVSKALRIKAQREGLDIDSVFRNKAGITFQMYSMESAYLGYIVRKQPATKLFAEVVNIRANDKPQYDALLKEALRMTADIKNRSEYQDWMMSIGMKNTAARNYGNWLNNIDAYVMKQGYSSKSVYKCSAEELVELYEMLIVDDDLVSNHRDYLVSFRKFVLYRSNGAIQLGRSRSASVGGLKAKRYEYQDWLMNTGMKDTAARNYGNWLNNIDAYAIQHGYSEQSIYEYEDLNDLTVLYDILMSDDELVANHRDYLVSFRKYVSYRSNGAIEFGRKRTVSATAVKTADRVKEEAPKVILETEEKERFSKILKEFFEEGLVLNAIRLDKFRMIYEEEFGNEPTSDDELLTNQLKLVGTFIDGRVYPKQEADQNSLLCEIRGEVLDALNEGASCVYISSVMTRWQQPLAEQLNIYNEIALRDLVISDDMPGVYATDLLFKMTRQKVSPDKDVLEYMKKCHAPVEYEKLKEKLWYIPMDTIKHALVTTPALVQVDWETYMYAPNFPASSNELQHLIKVMQAKIDEKGFLVSKDIAQLITEKCPIIAINTNGYKDWAYRNILRYVLRDYFEFGNSVVSEKGKKLEMRQVYRSFCRDYERLTFEELKQFSGEVGVQIYWDDVLTEMIRINQKEMIRKDLIHFDVDATDLVLDELCNGDYMPIKQVGLFLHFPPIEHPWNSYVLESYLQYSKRFMLYHVSYSENGVYGVVVRQNSALTDYQQVVVDMLANSNEWSDAQNALALIVDKGYQARKRWTGFDKVVQEALACREKILMEGK